MLKKSLFLAVFISQFATGQTINTSYATVANLVLQTNVTQILTDFEGLGVKTRGAAALTNTLNYIKAKYTAFGYTAAQITEQSFTNGSFTNKNLIVTKTGTLYPNTYVIICGHFDSIGGTGTNDNGSGTATMLEFARLIATIPTEYSVRIIHFSGEENGLVGSNAYLNNVVNATVPKMDIRILLNIDGIGRPSTTTNKIVFCERDNGNVKTTNDAASNVFNNQLMSYVGFYSNLIAQRDVISASDYMPFEANNEVVIGFYQSGAAAPYNHNASDLLVNMDPEYNFQITKATVGAMLHFSVATVSSLSLPTDPVIPPLVQASLEPVLIYPNPTSEYVSVKTKGNDMFDILVYDCSGRMLKQANGSSLILIDMEGYLSATYIFVITNRKTGQRYNREVIKI